MDITSYLREKKEMVDTALERFLPDGSDLPSSLFEAMRYGLLSGGKRIRAILCMAAYSVTGKNEEDVLPFACALEMVHAYSIIHDDLPCMDDDDYRRGKPTCHKVFGDAIALLAGDALLTEAFRIITDRAIIARGRWDDGLILDIVNEVAGAAGASGMVSGQAADIDSEGKNVDLSTLEYIHTRKTGRLILASVRVGAKLGGATANLMEAINEYGKHIGLAFQIADDILDVVGTRELLGKNTGSDSSKKKATYPALFGVEESRKKALELLGLAVDALACFGREADPLRELAQFVVSREY